MKSRGLLIYLACIPLTCSAADPLTVQRLSQIVEMPHQDRLDDDAMKIYPKARRYQLIVTSTSATGQSGTGKAIATEKWVNGRYIVSEAQPTGPESKFVMIVEYDRESKRYRKYILMAGKLSGFQEGTRVADSRSVAWIDLTSSKFRSDTDCLTIETHTDSSTTWTSTFYQRGRLLRSETGVASVITP